MATEYDLSLAYSPGVAQPCLEIQKNSETSFDYTNRGNLVGVISNGTAVLGLGNIGARGTSVNNDQFSSSKIDFNEKLCCVLH